jgi:nucleotide-binding universal stress UspA family protein
MSPSKGGATTLRASSWASRPTRNVRLIAMATRGAGVVRRALLGSVATGVLGRSELPVMMVGGRSARAGRACCPYHLLVTTDGSEAAGAVLPAVRRVLERVPREHVRLTLLRVHLPAIGDPPDVLELQRREMSAFKRRAPRRFPVDVELRADRRLGGAHLGILQAAGDRQVSAIWMATHGHSFSRQVLLGSVALSTVRQATIPVILTRAVR